MRSTSSSILFNVLLLPYTFAQPSMLTLTHESLSPLLNKNSLSFSHLSNSIYAPKCSPGFFPGTDTVLYTTPYRYSSVLSVIGNFGNLDYAFVPPQNLYLNGSGNTVGTARFYTSPALPSAQVIETLTVYSAPSTGPFVEVVAIDPFTVTSQSPTTNNEINVTMYSNYKAVIATPICLGGQATLLNYTIQFCATDPDLAAQISHQGHLSMAEGANSLLGNRSYWSCNKLQAEGGNGTLGYPGWGGGLFMGVGNSPQGEGAWWCVCLAIIMFFSYLIVLGGGVFNY